MRITVCGSIKFSEEMKNARSLLERMGHAILIPDSVDEGLSKDFWNGLKTTDPGKYAIMKAERLRGISKKIKSSDAVLILNYDKDGKKSHVGVSSLMEMAVAFEHGKRIFVLNPLPKDEPHYEETVSMAPVCLDGKLGNLK